MNTHYHIRLFTTTVMLAIVSGWLTSCKEEIDDSNRYTFTDETVLSYLEKDLNLIEGRPVSPEHQFSEYVSLLKTVPISDMSSSTVAQLLSARGHYTVFAPNNQAIYAYLQELKTKDIIDAPNWNGFRSQKDLDSIQKVIVYNSIVDGNDQEAYEIATFPINPKDPFARPNMYDRKLYWTYEGGETDIKKVANANDKYINGTALIDISNRDLKAVNGRIHEVHAVIAPSNDTMTDILKQWIAEYRGNFIVFSKLILECGLGDTLSKTRDEAWEKVWKENRVTDLDSHPSYGQYGHMPEHRKYGFTIFAETDDVYADLLGVSVDDLRQMVRDDINNVDNISNRLVSKLSSKLTEAGFYPDATAAKPTDEDNILNRFVTYHILPVAISRDKLVIHYNERGHNYLDGALKKTIPVYDYYTTMGKRRLLKIYEGDRDAESGIFLNRFPILQNGRGQFSEENQNLNDYYESGTFKSVLGNSARGEENQGIKILLNTDAEITDEMPFNGYIYPLENLLVYTENVQNQLFNERIRIDCATMFPEMINNDWRRPMGEYPKFSKCTDGKNCNKCVGFPAKPQYPYFNDIEIEENTSFYYLSGYAHGWSNYQMDEFNIIGNYEFTMKLPPVPKQGTYEIRFGVSAGSNNRSMCQVYFGTNKAYLPAAGIPMDLRVGFERTRFYGGSSQVSPFGYTSGTFANDAKLPQDEQDEIDKRLRSRGYMKGPEYFYYGTTPNNNAVGRNYEHVTRRIMVQAEMDPDKTYYIRFKNVLDNPKLEFFMDYLEFVSKNVYDNPVEPEDIW